MNIFLQKALACLLCVLTLSGMAAFSLHAQAAGTDDRVIAVTQEEIRRDGFSAAVQRALDNARDHAGSEHPVTVTVPEGSYDLRFGLHIYSNTTLDLRGVTVTRVQRGNMIRVGYEDTVNTGAVGYCYENITLLGGTLDGNAGYNTMIKVAHARRFTMRGMTLRNEHQGHMMEVAAVDGFTAQDCRFTDQLLDVGGVGYEAIQFDILHPNHMVNCRAEDLNMRDILVEDCLFENVPRAIGTHTAVLNNPFDGVTIRRNVFRDIKSAAIQGMNWKNCDISQNIIDGASRGITVFAPLTGAGDVFTAKALAVLGDTQPHVPSEYLPPENTNITIAYNTLRNIGTVDDIYAPYVCQGIAVIGSEVTEDGGRMPTGRYYNDGVRIHDNLIDVRGHGVRLEEARRAAVTDNEILCSPNTVHPANYYGVVLTDDVQADEISRNVIRNASVNGVQMVDSAVGSVSRNRVEGAGKYGVSAYTTTINTITDNDISQTTDDGIVLIAASSARRVQHNRVSDCKKTALYVTADSAAEEMSANTLVRNGGSVGYTASRGLVTAGSYFTSAAKTQSFSLGSEGVALGVGKSCLLTPAAQPVNAMPSYRYTSSNGDIAAVDDCGRITALGEGTATVTVTADGVTRLFRVEVTADGAPVLLNPETTDAPQITKLERTDSGIRISWNAVEGAHGYRLYYRYGSGAWKRFRDTASLSHTDTGVALGRTETYTIRTLDENGNPDSGYNPTGWSLTYRVGNPEVTSLRSTNEGIALSWNAVKGVSRYRVFFRNSKGGWSSLGTTASTDFTDTKVQSGRQETYTVRGLDKNGSYITGYNDEGWSLTYVGTPKLTSAQSVAGGVRLGWNKVAGAAGYRVFYRNSKGGWTRMGDTVGTTFLDSDVRSGGSYTYTVRCIDANGDYVSGYDAAGKRATYIAAPVVSVTGSGGKAQISWQPVKGAYAYRVFYRSAKGAWKSIVTTTASSFTDRDVARGKTYTYTVRCVDKSGNYVSGYHPDGVSVTVR